MKCKWTLSLGETTTCGAETLVKFVSETETYEQPSIVSATAGGHFNAIAVDNLVAAVREQDLCSINFRSTVDDLAILAGGYVAVGERSGVLTVGVLEGDNQFNVKLSCMLIPEAKGFTQKTFVHVSFQITQELNTESRAQIICLSHEGHLMTFSDIILENGDIDFSYVKQGKLATPHGKVFDVATLQNQIITVGSSPLCVASYTVVNGQVLLQDTASWDSEEPVEMVKIQILASASVFVTLDSKGKFYIWDMYTMTVVHTWAVADASNFQLIHVKMSQSFSFRLSDLKLLVVQPGKVQTLTLPTLAVSSEYTTGVDFAVLSKSSISQDEVYVAECSKFEDEDGVETRVHFRCYTEVNPVKRLQRLIAKKRYEEAEKFAKLFGLPFNLDPEIVQSKMREVQETFNDTVMHIRQCKEQLLKNKSQDSSVSAVLAELLELEHRLEAYRRVYGEENYNPSEWETFQYENPLTMCWKLVMVDAEKAFKLWACFQEDLQKQMKPGLLHQMLQRIPASVPCQMVVEWLCQAVIPSIVTSDPGAVTSIIQWVDDQIRILEMNGKVLWIDDAISVCKSVLESLEQAVTCDVEDSNYSDLQALKAKMNCGLALSPLKTLIKFLHGLNELKTKYKCHLTLGAFKKETKESIAYRMLDGFLDVHLLPVVLNGQVLPYLKHHKIDHDGVFAKYIQDLLERSDASHPHHLWEDKVKALIKVICDPKAKVTAVLNLLDHVMLPLPEFIEGLVSEVITTIQHPLVTSLKEKWNIKEADNILVMYGLNPKEVNSTFDARGAAKYVLASGGSISQAQKILLAHKISEDDAELPIFQCRLLVERNQVDKLTQYLKQLPSQTARLCCKFVMFNAKSLMANNGPSEQRMKAIRFQYYEAAVISASFLKSLSDDLQENEEIDKLVQAVKNAWCLEISKGICVNDVVLGDKMKCRSIFSTLAETSHRTTLIGLGRLLNLTDGEILEATISACATKSSSEIVAKILRQLAVLYGSCGCLPVTLIDNVLSVTDGGSLSISQCLRLAQLYAAHCSADKLKTALQVCQQASLLWDASVPHKGSLGIPATDTLDLGHFHEGATSSGLMKAQPDVTEALFAVLGDDKPLEDILQHVEDLTGELRKAEQLQLALRVLMLLSTRVEAVTTFLPSDDKQYCVDIVVKMTSMARDLASGLITKILNTVPVDVLLAEAYVLLLSKEQSVPLLQGVIRSCLSNYPKLKRVNEVACATAEILGDQKLIESSQRIQVIAKWGNRLSKIGIPLKSSALINISEAMEAAQKLIQSPHCDVDIIIEFFRDFRVEASQLNTILMQFFEVCLTVHSEDKFIPAVLKKAEHSLKLFQGDALKLLKKVLQETHPYNYEVLQFLLEKIQEREESRETLKGLELLRYLYHYKRCSAPSGVERKKFSCVLDENGELGHSSLPDAALSRLPFHLLQCKDSIWDVISAEINAHNLGLWLEMSPVLTISRASIFLKASTNITENHIRSSLPSPSSGAVSPEFCQVLAKVDSILTQLEEKEKAMWWCHTTFNKLTHVGEKTLALQGCVKHAKQWMKSATEPQQMETARKSVEMFSKKLQLYSTLWALCRAGLDKDKELTKLIKEPEDLIQQLYLMPCVVDDDLDEKTDINALSDEIADLNGTHLLDVRKLLLDKWLLGTSLVDQDQTLTFDVFPEDSTVNVKDSVKRALYMMESRDRGDLLQHVAGIARLADVTVNSAAHKRSLYCLLNTATQEEIADLLGREH